MPGNDLDLSWLADAPVFIDSRQVGAFYDAVVGPAFKTVQLQVSAGQNEQSEIGRSEPQCGPARLVSLAEGRRRHGREQVHDQESQSIVLEPVENATRQLVQLCLHYLVNQEDRIRLVSSGTAIPLPEDISASPRMIAFVDVPPGTMFLPQA
jgi:hypothetical protein